MDTLYRFLSRLAYTIQLWAWRVQHYQERRRARRVDRQCIEQLEHEYGFWRWRKYWERKRG